MKKTGLSLVAVTLWLTVLGQSQLLPMRIDTSRESVTYWTKWADNLYDNGVENRKDSFFVKEEVMRLLRDSSYRRETYPLQYQWSDAISLLQKMDLKRAFWYMINLYQADTQHRDLVVGTFALYDSLMDMDKVLASTYYTYTFPDPRVCRIVNGKTDIYRPDILEKGLNATREITGYIWDYRRRKAAGKP